MEMVKPTPVKLQILIQWRWPDGGANPSKRAQQQIVMMLKYVDTVYIVSFSIFLASFVHIRNMLRAYKYSIGMIVAIVFL